MNEVLDWVLNRMKEKSSWIAVLGLATTAIGLNLAPEMQEAVMGVGLALVSLLSLLIREKGSPDNLSPPK